MTHKFLKSLFKGYSIIIHDIRYGFYISGVHLLLKPPSYCFEEILSNVMKNECIYLCLNYNT